MTRAGFFLTEASQSPLPAKLSWPALPLLRRGPVRLWPAPRRRARAPSPLLSAPPSVGLGQIGARALGETPLAGAGTVAAAAPDA
jgi:hypothetical protein